MRLHVLDLLNDFTSFFNMISGRLCEPGIFRWYTKIIIFPYATVAIIAGAM